MELAFLVWLQGLHRPWLDELMAGVTFLGDAGWVWISDRMRLILYEEDPKLRSDRSAFPRCGISFGELSAEKSGCPAASVLEPGYPGGISSFSGKSQRFFLSFGTHAGRL